MSSSKELKEAHPTNDMSAIKGFAASLPGMKAMLGEKLSSKMQSESLKASSQKLNVRKKQRKRLLRKKQLHNSSKNAIKN